MHTNYFICWQKSTEVYKKKVSTRIALSPLTSIDKNHYICIALAGGRFVSQAAGSLLTSSLLVHKNTQKQGVEMPETIVCSFWTQQQRNLANFELLDDEEGERGERGRKEGRIENKSIKKRNKERIKEKKKEKERKKNHQHPHLQPGNTSPVDALVFVCFRQLYRK